MLTIAHVETGGRYLETDGTPLEGYIDFTPSADHLIANTGDDSAVILPAPVRLYLEQGELTGELPATDDPAWNPTDWQYIVAPNLTTAGGTRMPTRTFRISAPAGKPIDLPNETPLIPSNGTPILRGEKGEKGESGDQGPVGPSHYERAVANGYTGTELEYVTEFRGPQGFTGERGPAGPEGPEGPKGEDSTVPGPAGPRGPEGPVGPRGPEGPAGERGPKGEDGQTYRIAGGVATADDLPESAEPGDVLVAEDLDHVYAWTANGWTFIGTGIVRGPEGPEGPRGPAGERGEIGPQGEPGQTGPAGIGERGPRGEQGPEGPAGPAGPQGERGIPGEASNIPGPQGEPGQTGPRGPQGERGERGETGPAGPQGERGETGPQGERGETGPQGDPGTAIRWIGRTPTADQLPASGFRGDAYTADDTGVTWIRTDNGWESMGSFRGEKGDPGPEGPAGPQGEPGERGPEGRTGERGPEGRQGPAGPQGERGEAGPAGPMPASAVHVVMHGDDRNAPRPEGAVLVMWIGGFEPANAWTHDEWHNTREAA